MEILPERQYADFVVKNTGKDFFKELQKLTNDVRQNGVATVGLTMPTDKPFVCRCNEELNLLGYFFCGIKPVNDGSWALEYTNLLYQAFDFGKIQFFSDDTKALCQYVKNEHDRTLALLYTD